MIKLSKLFILPLLLTLALFLAPLRALAQTTSLTVIPPKFELFGNPGDSLVERIRLRNESNEPRTYTIYVEDFTTSGEEGHVVLEEGESDESFAMAKWIEASVRDVVLQPNEEQSITVNINIPRNAEPGGHYASVLFQTGGDVEVDGGAKVSQRVGSLILLRVSGNVVENAILEQFTTDSFQQKGPIEFLLRVKNESNTHIIPEGTIVITNLFGKKVAELPLDGRNVLPGAIRKMTTLWDSENILGIYTATLISTYGQQKLPLTAVTKFTVLPTGLLIVGFVGVFAVVGLVVTLIFGRNRIVKILKVIFKGED